MSHNASFIRRMNQRAEIANALNNVQNEADAVARAYGDCDNGLAFSNLAGAIVDLTGAVTKAFDLLSDEIEELRDKFEDDD